MPQLDSLTYISSLFWIVLTFAVYYILYVKEVLPNLSGILKVRNLKESVMKEMVAGGVKKENLLFIKYSNLYKSYKKIWQ